MPFSSLQRFIEEFQANEKSLADMKQEVQQYLGAGKVEAANRLRDQVNLLEERFQMAHSKLNTFTSPQANFETRLNRALGELRNIERSSCVLDVASAGPGNVHDQYKHCLKMYRTLSEIKSEIETVIKTGRKVCEDKTTKHPKKLSMSIDALKHLYNALGEHVTQSKNNLEKLLRVLSAVNANVQLIENWISARTEYEKSGGRIVPDVPLNSVLEIQAVLDKCEELYREYNEICESSWMDDLRAKLDHLAVAVGKVNAIDHGKRLIEIQATLQQGNNLSQDSFR